MGGGENPSPVGTGGANTAWQSADERLTDAADMARHGAGEGFLNLGDVPIIRQVREMLVHDIPRIGNRVAQMLADNQLTRGMFAEVNTRLADLAARVGRLDAQVRELRGHNQAQLAGNRGPSLVKAALLTTGLGLAVLEVTTGAVSEYVKDLYNGLSRLREIGQTPAQDTAGATCDNRPDKPFWQQRAERFEWQRRDEQ